MVSWPRYEDRPDDGVTDGVVLPEPPKGWRWYTRPFGKNDVVLGLKRNWFAGLFDFDHIEGAWFNPATVTEKQLRAIANYVLSAHRAQRALKVGRDGRTIRRRNG